MVTGRTGLRGRNSRMVVALFDDNDKKTSQWDWQQTLGLFLNCLRETRMRVKNLLAAVMAAGLFAAPAFAAEQAGGSGSDQIHCSPAKNGNAAADPNCLQRDPPMPAQGNTGAQASGTVNSGSTQR
jgi:hypothetical protein